MPTWYQNLRMKTCSLRLRAFTPGLTPGVLSPISDGEFLSWGEPWQRLATPTAQAPLESQGSQDSPPGMVLVGYWRPKQCHKTVAEKLIDRALIAVHFA